MTIDERIEAIAQQVELLGQMQLKTEDELQRTNRGLNRMLKGLNRLRKYALLIASDHEARIAALEMAATDDEGDDAQPEKN
jgi:hypothetical protein